MVPARVAISLIALYALILQAYGATAAPAFDPAGDTRCMPGETRQGDPAGGTHDHDCLCCALACVACGVAFMATASEPVLPLRQGSIVTFAEPKTTAGLAPRRFYFAARAPPAGL